MVVCILSNNRKDRYDTIKKFVCIEKPVPSQMVIGKTISKPDLVTAVATKVSIQINCKLGGKWRGSQVDVNLSLQWFESDIVHTLHQYFIS